MAALAQRRIGAQPLRHQFDEGAGLGRSQPALLMDDVNGLDRIIAVAQHRAQLAGSQQRRGLIGQQTGNADAGHRGGDRRLIVADGESGRGSLATALEAPFSDGTDAARR